MPTNRVRQADNPQFDLSPWVETPSSSRVSRFRYDHANQAVQVQWTNNLNHGYVYYDVPYEQYRLFARAVSKGKKINTQLNGYRYELMSEEQVDAGSNTNRSGVASRVRG